MSIEEIVAEINKIRDEQRELDRFRAEKQAEIREREQQLDTNRMILLRQMARLLDRDRKTGAHLDAVG